MGQNHGRFAVKGIMKTANGPCPHGSGPHYTIFAISFADMIHSYIKVQHFFGIIEKVDLIITGNEIAEFHPYQTNQKPPLVQALKKFPYFGDQYMIGRGIWNL